MSIATYLARALFYARQTKHKWENLNCYIYWIKFNLSNISVFNTKKSFYLSKTFSQLLTLHQILKTKIIFL